MSLRTHVCKKSRGGGESGPAEAALRFDRSGGPARAKLASEVSAPAKVGRDLDGGGANPPARKRAQGSAPGCNRTSAGVATGPREFKKPLAKDAHKTLMATKPWDIEGISRRTWYRRNKSNG